MTGILSQADQRNPPPASAHLCCPSGGSPAVWTAALQENRVPAALATGPPNPTQTWAFACLAAGGSNLGMNTTGPT